MTKTKTQQRMVDALVGTSRIKPEEFAYNTSPDRLKSLSYAVAGWIYMLAVRRIRAFRVSPALLFWGWRRG